MNVVVSLVGFNVCSGVLRFCMIRILGVMYVYKTSGQKV